MCFELFGEQRIKDNPCNIDDLVTVSFDLESREFNGRWYTSVRAWKIAQAAEQTAPQQPQPQVTQQQPAANVETFDSVASASMDDGTDLPF